MTMSLEAAAQAMRQAMRETVRVHDHQYAQTSCLRTRVPGNPTRKSPELARKEKAPLWALAGLGV